MSAYKINKEFTVYTEGAPVNMQWLYTPPLLIKVLKVITT
jgi:hypothetical protein